MFLESIRCSSLPGEQATSWLMQTHNQRELLVAARAVQQDMKSLLCSRRSLITKQETPGTRIHPLRSWKAAKQVGYILGTFIIISI